MSDKQFLGDGVYADIEHGMVKLTTEDGVGVTNTIYLEREVIDAFFKYLMQRQAQVSGRWR